MGFYHSETHNICETLKGDSHSHRHALSGIINILFKDDILENLWFSPNDNCYDTNCYSAVKRNRLTDIWYFVVIVVIDDNYYATRALKVVLLKHGGTWLFRDISGFPVAIFRGNKPVVPIKEELIMKLTMR